MEKRWELYEDDEKEIQRLANDAAISPLTAKLLLHRGISDKVEAENFLHPDNASFYDPFLMLGMKEGVQRILGAMESKEKIVVYGDYDVDGITATSLLVRVFRSLGANVRHYIPLRLEEGYGLNTKAMQKLKEEGASLIITVDCGITAVKEVAAMNGELDIIITDHHLADAVLPDAFAVINPHQDGCPYPEKNLCGVGVAFKLCQALYKTLGKDEFEDLTELAALGTIADIVPLTGENRKLAHMGLAAMENSQVPGIRSLIKVANLDGKNISSGKVGFQLAPRLNAAGRLGNAADGVELLITEDEAKADEIAQKLNAENAHRQDIERNILALSIEKLADKNPEDLPAIVVSGEGWHPGVIGIVASKLVDRYYRPVVVIGEEGDVGKASCRSIPPLHLRNALSTCEQYFTQFGGHEGAAGFTIPREKIPLFERDFLSHVKETLKDEDYIPRIKIETLTPPHELDLKTLEEISKLAPFGMGNPHPLFGAKNICPRFPRTVGREEQHLTFKTEGGSHVVYWNGKDYMDLVAAENVDLVYSPQLNEWQGNKSVEAVAEDLAPAKRVFPGRDVLGKIYLALKAMANHGEIPKNPAKAARISGLDVGAYAMEAAMKIFAELDILSPAEKGFAFKKPQTKLDLMASPFYRRHQK